MGNTIIKLVKITETKTRFRKVCAFTSAMRSQVFPDISL